MNCSLNLPDELLRPLVKPIDIFEFITFRQTVTNAVCAVVARISITVDMKLVFLPLFCLIVFVYADNEVIVDPSAEVDQLTADTLYETLFSDFYKPQKVQPSSKKSSKNKNASNIKSQGLQTRGSSNGYENKNKQSNTIAKDMKFVSDDYLHYLQPLEGYKAEYESRLIGRKGLGFDKRTATTYGFRAPITAELLEENGQKYQKKNYNDEKVYPLLI